jgi:hypothetical protein
VRPPPQPTSAGVPLHVTGRHAPRSGSGARPAGQAAHARCPAGAYSPAAHASHGGPVSPAGGLVSPAGTCAGAPPAEDRPGVHAVQAPLLSKLPSCAQVCTWGPVALSFQK